MNSSPKSIPGAVFFSPAIESNPGAQVDVSLVKLLSRITDTYSPPPSENAIRPFMLGPAPTVASGRAWPPDFSASYEPVLNSSQYGLMSNKPGSAIRGELVDTTTFEVTVVLV